MVEALRVEVSWTGDVPIKTESRLMLSAQSIAVSDNPIDVEKGLATGNRSEVVGGNGNYSLASSPRRVGRIEVVALRYENRSW